MPHEHVAFYVTLAEFAGNQFDWHAMAFKKPRQLKRDGGRASYWPPILISKTNPMEDQ